jgi:hypothetical protein
MTDLFYQSPLESTVAALRNDLMAEGGPRISTMRNYPFAILLYKPADEFELRRQVRRLGDELKGKGWRVLNLSLYRVFLDLLEAEEPDVIDSIRQREQRLHAKNPDRSLRYLLEKFTAYAEEPDGIATAVARRIDEFVHAHPDSLERGLIFAGRAGALYPFFRNSALLRFLDGKTCGIPFVLLYPGRQEDKTALSFMGELKADRDYRPRIYA